MVKISFILLLLFGFAHTSLSQEKTQKEKAEALAQNEFSKTKQKEKIKSGVVKEKNRVVVSIPVIKTDLSFYHGNYANEDLDCKVEIRSDEKNNLVATLKIGVGPETLLHFVSIRDAFFQAKTKNENRLDDVWEGVFVNRNDDGNTEFGLGLKLPKSGKPFPTLGSMI